jgi:hypothetical protein
MSFSEKDVISVGQIPLGAYIEIVHASPEDITMGWLRDNDQDIRTAGAFILDLVNSGYNVHYHTQQKLDSNFPKIPKDAPVVVGGGLLTLNDDSGQGGCVGLRVQELQAAGFREVHADERISIVITHISM